MQNSNFTHGTWVGKSMVQKCCYQTGRDWDKGLPFMFFAISDAKQESLGFSPAKLVFGHSVNGPLKVLQEYYMSSSVPKNNVLNFVSQFRALLPRATSLAREVLSSSQDNMKNWFDCKTVSLLSQ